MANAADITHGPDGTPEQETLDSMVNAFEFVPPTELIDEKIEELKAYIKDLEDAAKKGAKDAYDEALARFNEKKEELLAWLRKLQAEIEAKIKKITDPIVSNFEKQIPPEVKVVADVDLQAPSITPKLPAADPGAIVSYLSDLVLALVMPYKPIIKVIQWWITDFIPKMTAYTAKRIAKLIEYVNAISALVPPPPPV